MERLVDSEGITPVASAASYLCGDEIPSYVESQSFSQHHDIDIGTRLEGLLRRMRALEDDLLVQNRRRDIHREVFGGGLYDFIIECEKVCDQKTAELSNLKLEIASAGRYSAGHSDVPPRLHRARKYHGSQVGETLSATSSQNMNPQQMEPNHTLKEDSEQPQEEMNVLLTTLRSLDDALRHFDTKFSIRLNRDQSECVDKNIPTQKSLIGILASHAESLQSTFAHLEAENTRTLERIKEMNKKLAKILPQRDNPTVCSLRGQLEHLENYTHAVYSYVTETFSVLRHQGQVTEKDPKCVESSIANEGICANGSTANVVGTNAHEDTMNGPFHADSVCDAKVFKGASLDSLPSIMDEALAERNAMAAEDFMLKQQIAGLKMRFNAESNDLHNQATRTIRRLRQVLKGKAEQVNVANDRIKKFKKQLREALERQQSMKQNCSETESERGLVTDARISQNSLSASKAKTEAESEILDSIAEVKGELFQALALPELQNSIKVLDSLTMLKNAVNNLEQIARNDAG